MQKSCPIDENIKLQYDTRFTSAGFSVSEYETQMNSGVLAKLHDLPLYNQYVRNEYSAKTNVKYNFMTRSLIPWKLSCDQAAGTSRIEVIYGLQNSGPRQNESVQMIFAEGICFLVAPIVTYLVFLCMKSSKAAKTSFVFLFTIEVMLLLFVSVFSL